MSKVIVIGGGAAGMMAAVSAAANHNQTVLLEKNEKLGKKLFITGKGRCNLTNDCDNDKLFENVVTNPKFLYSAFSFFDNKKLMRLIEDAGCPLKTERGGRVFPASDKSSDVIAALKRLLEKERVEVRLNTKAEGLIIDWNERRVKGVRMAEGKNEYADAVILAAGGLSYPATGSDGDGYRFAKEAGHKIISCVPALSPFETEQDFCGDLQGLSLKNAALTMYDKDKKVYSGVGEMLFTHFGLSGPLALSAGSFYHKCRNKDKVRLEIDLKPALTQEKLDARILRDFSENSNRQFKNALNGLFPARLIPVMIELSGIEPEKKVNGITKEERLNFVYIIKHLTLEVRGLRGFDEAIITQGGVDVKEINPSTMESRLAGGLYMAGEMLNVDALTGGFNLQIAWSTGYLAGAKC